MPSSESRAIRTSLRRDDPYRTTTLAEERAAWLSSIEERGDTPGICTCPTTLREVDALEICPEDAETRVIVYVHGGGLVSGAPETHRALATMLAQYSRSRVLVPRYRLLPEHSAADAMADVMQAIEAACQRPDNARIYVGGDSSGAALALGALLALGYEANRIAGFFAISGAFDALLRSPSMIDNAKIDPTLSRAELERWRSLVGARAALDAVPFNLLDCDLRGAPPTLLLAGGDELWRDDSVRLHERLSTVGVRAELKIYAGMWHVWPMFGGFPEAASAVTDVAEFIRRERA